MVERRRGRHGVEETWEFVGELGDSVLAEVWLPAEVRRIAVLGHGADNHRRARYIEVAARAWSESGTAVVSMDAPRHGDRGDGSEIEAVGADVHLFEQWVKDHRRLIDAIESRFPDLTVGFVGFSMGGLFAVPLAAVDARVRGLVLVVAGSTRVSYPRRYPDRDLTVLASTDPAVHAPEIEIPVLMLNTEDDEVVPLDAAWALFDAFGDPKELVVGRGDHERWRDAADWYRRMDRFLVGAL